MESVLGRYRNLTILVGVLFLQVLGLAVQVKRSADAENTRLIRVWAVDLITPFERGLVFFQHGAGDLWRNYFYLRGVRAENRQLKEQIAQMRLEQVRLSEDAAQAHRLQSLLAFKEQFIGKPLPAQVIGSSGSDLSRSIYIDKGSNDGVGQDMAVITADGIVGKVLRVYPSTSLVLMINDQSSGVGVLLEKSRLQGVLRGTPDGELTVERIMSDEQVAPGETVLSSGGDQIFPKGLPVGTVSKVGPGKELFLGIKVKPAADLSRLEEVLVVTEKQERQPLAESGPRVRAADVLAQRLPSVPDKPATVAGTPASGAAANAKPGPGTTAAEKPLAGGATAAPFPGSGAKSVSNGSTASASAASNNGSQGGVRSVPVAGSPVTGEALKKAVQNPPADGSAANGSVADREARSASGLNAGAAKTALGAASNPTPKASTNTAPNTSPKAAPSTTPKTAPNSTSNALNVPAKPPATQAKPASPASTPKPSAREDTPH